MRSRYCAYALGDSGYLRDTWHAEYRPADFEVDSRIRWLGLEIIADSEQGDCASVEFEARFLCGGRVDAIHEVSEFLRQGGRWVYTRGEQLAPRLRPWNPARNESCPCGSGRKFKRCCAADSGAAI
jgi:SEC-C motif-containing protein